MGKSKKQSKKKNAWIGYAFGNKMHHVNADDIPITPPPPKPKFFFRSKAGTHTFDSLEKAKRVHAEYSKTPNQGNNKYGRLTGIYQK